MFELIPTLILSSFSKMLNKIRFTFEFFDLAHKSSLEYEDLVFMFKAFLIGYARLTDT